MNDRRLSVFFFFFPSSGLDRVFGRLCKQTSLQPSTSRKRALSRALVRERSPDDPGSGDPSPISEGAAYDGAASTSGPSRPLRPFRGHARLKSGKDRRPTPSTAVSVSAPPCRSRSSWTDEGYERSKPRATPATSRFHCRAAPKSIYTDCDYFKQRIGPAIHCTQKLLMKSTTVMTSRLAAQPKWWASSGWPLVALRPAVDASLRVPPQTARASAGGGAVAVGHAGRTRWPDSSRRRAPAVRAISDGGTHAGRRASVSP